MAFWAQTSSTSPSRPPQQALPASSVPDTGTIRCLCDFTDDDGHTIFCEGCGFWQHMSCFGLANLPGEELPDMWYCWHCRPEKFEWIQNNGTASGDTLAVRLGISPTHWNLNYVTGLGLQLDTSGRPIPGSTLATSSNRSSALSISNLLSPVPYSTPPPPQPKILLDAAKARKRQEQRRVEEEPSKRHQREAAAAIRASASWSGPSGSNYNGTNNTARTTRGAAGPASALRVRTPSVAAGGNPSKEEKQSPVSATTGGAVAGPSTSGALTSTLGTAASSFTGPSTVNTVSSSAPTAATSAKRKSSDASAARKRKKKDHPSKVAIPESSPRFNYNSHGTQPFPTPLPTSIPRTSASGAFLPPKSPGRVAQQHLFVGVPGQARSRSRSLSVDVENRMAVDVEVGPNGPYLDVGHPSEIDDYFTGGAGKGKRQEKEAFALPAPWSDGSQRQSFSPKAKLLEVCVPSGPTSLVYGLDVEQQWASPSSKGSAGLVAANTTSLAPAADIETLITWISPMPVKVNGHFCDVFAGTHSTVGKVALKRPRIGTAGFNEDIIRRFQREAATWEKLQHRHILEYLGSFQRDSHFYFVSPFIEDGTLVEYIALQPNVNRIKLLCETADAITYLHQQDIVHGDIKGSNLLIGNNGQVLLCDFGLTRTTDFRTSTAMKGAGTLRWQSPELWNGSSKSFKSDVYAFGMTIVEVLTGAVPFPDLETDGAVICAVMIDGRRPPKLPAESSAGLSYEKIWAVAEASWASNPKERISMSEILQLLQEDPALAAV